MAPSRTNRKQPETTSDEKIQHRPHSSASNYRRKVSHASQMKGRSCAVESHGHSDSGHPKRLSSLHTYLVTSPEDEDIDKTFVNQPSRKREIYHDPKETTPSSTQQDFTAIFSVFKNQFEKTSSDTLIRCIKHQTSSLNDVWEKAKIMVAQLENDSQELVDSSFRRNKDFIEDNDKAVESLRRSTGAFLTSLKDSVELYQTEYEKYRTDFTVFIRNMQSEMEQSEIHTTNSVKEAKETAKGLNSSVTLKVMDDFERIDMKSVFSCLQS